MNRGLCAFLRGALIPGVLLALSAAAAAAAAFPAAAFNGHLSADERARLDAGEILIRNIGKASALSLNPIAPEAQSALDAVRALEPSYLVEVIQILPYREDERIAERLRAVLADVPSYRGIPYWSQRHERWFDLYSSADIRESVTNGARTDISAVLVMSPFTPIDARIALTGSGDGLFFSMTNANVLKADGITAVKKECLRSVIAVFRAGDSLILYGAGGVRAPVIFFLKQRIEISFLNRIKTFCMYVYGKL